LQKTVENINERLDKEMKPWRSVQDGHGEEQVVSWVCETEQEEAREIARLIANLNASGLPFSDIAILARSRASYPKILEELAVLGIPVQPGSTQLGQLRFTTLNAATGAEANIIAGTPVRLATMRVSTSTAWAFPNINPFLPVTGSVIQVVTAAGKTPVTPRTRIENSALARDFCV
jgi:hypothetical protein